jgi:hypothetical protein
MKTRIVTILLGISMLCSSFNVGKKVFFIYIEEELAHAKTIQLIKVYGYSNNVLLYGTSDSKDTLKTNSRLSEKADLKISNKTTKAEFLQNLGGKWPAIGEEVLMVTDSSNRLNLLAFRIGKDYRFWTPYHGPFANSIFIYPDQYPFKNLPGCVNVLIDDKTEPLSCADGCLVDNDFIKERK